MAGRIRSKSGGEMSIVLIDTSVFCEIINVPGKCNNPRQVFDEVERLIRNNVTLLLPIATILETGRHISQVENGQVRRQTAIRFVELVQNALQNAAPWTISQPILNPVELERYLVEFPDYAMREISLGDLSIIKEFERQCELHFGHEIYIWALDHHLIGYRHNPPHWMNG